MGKEGRERLRHGFWGMDAPVAAHRWTSSRGLSIVCIGAHLRKYWELVHFSSAEGWNRSRDTGLSGQ